MLQGCLKGRLRCDGGILGQFSLMVAVGGWGRPRCAGDDLAPRASAHHLLQRLGWCHCVLAEQTPSSTSGVSFPSQPQEMAPLFAVRQGQEPSFPLWQVWQLGLFLPGFILFLQLFPEFLAVLQEQGWALSEALLLWDLCLGAASTWSQSCFQNTHLVICFCGHTGILKSPIVLLEAEENHSFLCREQSCSLFSKDFPLLSEGEAVPPGSTSWTAQWHPWFVPSGTLAHQGCHCGVQCSPFLLLEPFCAQGRDQDTQKAQPHLHQNRPHMIPCTHRPCWKALRVYFRDKNVF